jgi:sulfate permease, SulP family
LSRWSRNGRLLLAKATLDPNAFASVVVLRLRNMTALDATGLHALERLADRLKKSGRTLVLCLAREQPKRLLEQGEFIEHVGAENIVEHVSAALRRAGEISSQFGGLGHDVAAEMQERSL